MYNNYPDGMRESDLPGYYEWETTLEVSCTASPELKFVNPSEISSFLLRSYQILSKPEIDMKRLVDNINKLDEFVKNAPYFEVECDFKGEVDVICDRNNYSWECPKCGSEHDDELPRDDD